MFIKKILKYILWKYHKMFKIKKNIKNYIHLEIYYLKKNSNFLKVEIYIILLFYTLFFWNHTLRS